MDPLVTPADADALIAAAMTALPIEEVALEGADRRILRAPLVADRPLPPYDRVMMDGICFRTEDSLTAGSRLPNLGISIILTGLSLRTPSSIRNWKKDDRLESTFAIVDESSPSTCRDTT